MMEPLRELTAVAAPLLRDNVDTDAIIPSREMKTVSKTGLADGLFAGWRYLAIGGREPDPAFVLNQSAYAGARILLGGVNFGCGSSREHAPWALADYGFRAVVAPTFADIFFNNCFQNGMVPVRLDEADVEELFRRGREAAGQGGQYRLTVDLRGCTIRDDAGFSRSFTVDPFRRQCLLEGLDDIGLSLRHASEITAWETAHGLPAAAN
jgi:3-isopropylmalate/(R)-2-methylmalate dehydratase small subunit